MNLMTVENVSINAVELDFFVIDLIRFFHKMLLVKEI